jgi:endoglucanase
VRAIALAALLAVGVLPGRAVAGIANAGLAGAPRANPLAGLPWGTYRGKWDDIFPHYATARGPDRVLLAPIALTPRMLWFGGWFADRQVESIARQYVESSTGGDPNVLSQLAVFRVKPWEGAACRRLPSASEQASYKRWIDNLAQGLGAARVALVLQPDLPFAHCVPHHSKLPLRLIAYAARVFSALPHTTVYIDAGASDWPSVGQAAAELRDAGVANTRGFALGATHYDSTAREILFGASVAARLGTLGIRGRHFIINTAQNGRPFTYQEFHGTSYDNAPVCATRAASRCVSLGIPPTWHVTERRWHLSARARALAGRLVDAYMWIGRPWLDHQAEPFDLGRTLALARVNPF